MAPNVQQPHPGRMARVVHWVALSPRVAIILVATDIALSLGNTPTWVRVLAGVLVHAAAATTRPLL